MSDEPKRSIPWVGLGFMALLIGALLFLAMSLLGCANALDTARQAVVSSTTVEVQAMQTLAKYDLDHQKAIVEGAATKEAGELALKEYRDKRRVAEEAILASAATTASLAAAIPLVEAGQQKQSSLTTWLTELFNAGLKIRDALSSLGIGVK